MKLLVTQGSLAGQEFTIEKDVTRVGSDPQCEIKIGAEGVPPHALTLRRRGDKYVVYNRCPRSLMLAEKPIATEQSAEWPPGIPLSLGDGVGFMLVQGAAAPAPRAAASVVSATPEVDEWVEGDDFHDELDPKPDEATAPKKKSNAVEITVTALLVLGSVVSLLVDPGKGTAKVTRKDVDKRSVEISAELGAIRGQDALLAQVEMLLKGASLSLGKGDKKGAVARYVAARNIMLRRLDREGKFASKLDEKVDELIRNNLTLLQ